jgi:hypothetical protein
MAKLIGTDPNQVPTNADLGTMAYQDKDNLDLQGSTFRGGTYARRGSTEGWDGTTDTNYPVIIPVYETTAKNADYASLASASSNPDNTATLAAGNDIMLCDLGFQQSSPTNAAQKAATPHRTLPDGYVLSARCVIVGDGDTLSGDGTPTDPILLRCKAHDSGTWYDWEWRSSYYHAYWGVYYMIQSPWLAMQTATGNATSAFFLGCRTGSTYALKWKRIMVQVAYVPEAVVADTPA